jgi:radical SAM superfamily enzyme YgiQ (UPF0313 family)
MDIDILFVDPPWFKDDETIWGKVGSCMPSLGIAYMASLLEQKGKSVRIIDCTAEKLSPKECVEFIKRMNVSPKFIGFTATTSIIKNAYKIAKECKKLFPKSIIIFGGAHPSSLPDEALSNGADIVIRGEGENTLCDLLAGKSLGDIEGISYKKNNKVVHNKNRVDLVDINKLPLPAYHLLPMKKYYPALGNYKRLPAMSIVATRGCPGKCIFCHRTCGSVLRTRSADNIINEINFLKKEYGIKEISFYDDTFTFFRKNVEEFCNKIIEQKIDITWSCFSRVDFIDERLLKLMKKAGCHLILYGAESADGQILKNIKKNISLDTVRRVVKLTKKVGIRSRVAFMFGNPGETEETIKKTIKFALELNPDEVQFNITTPYPGTEMFDWAEKNGYLLTKDWNDYRDYSSQVVELPTVSNDVIKRYYRMAYIKFYLRLSFMFNWVFNIKSFTQFKQAVKGFFVIISLLLFKSRNN